MENVNKWKSLLVMSTGFLALHFIFDIEVLKYVAIGVSLIALIIPPAGTLLVYLWNKLAEGLGWLNSKIILGAVFYLFLFPISILYRLTKKGVVMSKSNGESYYKIRDHEYVSKDLEDLW